MVHLLKVELDSPDLRRARFEQQESVDLVSEMLPSDDSAPTTFYIWLSLLSLKMLEEPLIDQFCQGVHILINKKCTMPSPWPRMWVSDAKRNVGIDVRVT